MIEQLATAFERKDYHTATKLLKQLLKETPENPWVQFYLGRLHEVSEKHQQADKIYRHLLRSTTNSKILTQARQGLQRLQEIEQEERQRAISKATSEPSNTELGVLVLEPLATELKTIAAPKFAQIMQLDPYTARLLLPSRGWRFYRTGQIGELKFYGQQLQQASIPCFWTTIAAVEQIQVFQLKYFSESQPKPTIVCRNQENQLGSLTFDWSEVTAKVVGRLPMFEQVIDLDNRGRLERKTETQDYIEFCDLHLPSRNCILRLYDHGYEFQKGVEMTSQASQNTTRINWNSLLQWISPQIPKVKTWSNFTSFAQTILDQTEMLGNIESHIHLLRREKTNWDPAFHLYSGLVFVNEAQNFRAS
ncbi:MULTISPECIES: tetratricopeptide repeat protein [Cyanophyceae]|uniref:tetratricopeptide repeat protein n=1 Tax=Cyanophyceae TaxID=3028117 RepID=UPI0023307D29|nr:MULTISPECIES: tetratricopeptide repeat protein [Cyanophyceae]MDB9355296.1 tetratricopeptide repeat protein [Nodularia spumigena CS-587/03]MDB9304711.1 tetratricopeptide repeat protein [Nodularia spumigena CS-591/12]MDB9341037.1 tetratricopeptide repeat protein [Nodularia spumigena CS-589/07]MDB9401093.1 tetratricopeptide repeat protein [Microcystis aeruginosa CS-567/02-A1]MDB9498161.1 tetratricopeptide repeat protein [Nodularia spumigena CS-336/02]